MKNSKKSLIKVCGLTDVKEASYLNENKIDFAGFVLFFPKSKRNITINQAEKIAAQLEDGIKKVAVVVSPDEKQIREINASVFDYVQIHGEIKEEVLKIAELPVIKAFNIDDMSELERYKKNEKIKGFVFDAAKPGSGKAFDWNILKKIECGEKLLILAGGLNALNVREAVEFVNPDVVDVSSGVEYAAGGGKDPEKIYEFVNQLRS